MLQKNRQNQSMLVELFFQQDFGHNLCLYERLWCSSYVSKASSAPQSGKADIPCCGGRRGCKVTVTMSDWFKYAYQRIGITLEWGDLLLPSEERIYIWANGRCRPLLLVGAMMHRSLRHSAAVSTVAQ